MAKKTETKTEKIEREYIIPLRAKYQHVPRYKKTPKAIKTIKEFVARHMKIYDRDLKKIKIENYLNDFMWSRGIKNPPYKIKVRAIKENDIVKVELVDYPEKLKYKKLKAESIEKISKKAAEKKKEEKKLEEKPEVSTTEKIEETKREEENQKAKLLASSSEAQAKEKKAAVIEAGKEMEKSAAKQMKHQSKIKSKDPKRHFRQALQK